MTEKTPNTLTLTTTRGTIRGLLKVAGKADVRYYLNGICADFDKRLLLVTNGHAMLWTQPDTTEGTGKIILPRDLLEPFTKGGKSVLHQPIEIAIEGENVTVTDPENKAGRIQTTGKTLDGRFPDCEQIVPAKLSGEPAHFDPQLVATVHSAMQDIEANSAITLRLHHNGQSAGLATFLDTHAIIMPIREDTPAADDLAAARQSFGLKDETEAEAEAEAETEA